MKLNKILQKILTGILILYLFLLAELQGNWTIGLLIITVFLLIHQFVYSIIKYIIYRKSIGEERACRKKELLLNFPVIISPIICLGIPLVLLILEYWLAPIVFYLYASVIVGGLQVLFYLIYGLYLLWRKFRKK
jgi:hypothetical protein